MSSLLFILRSTASRRSDRPFLWERGNGRWSARTWSASRRDVSEASTVESHRRPFTIDNDLLTPTLKLRRHWILDHYRGEITRLYHPPGRARGA